MASTWGLSWGTSWGTSWDLALVEVPDVVGETQAAGTTTLEGEGFVVSVETEYSESVDEGLIISQDPTGGSFASPGSTVTIVVSLGPEPETPPAEQPEGGDDAWKYQGRLPKQRDYRPELDERRVRERQELRETIERAAGLLEEAEALVEVADSPELAQQVNALRTEFNGLRNETQATDRKAAQVRVDRLIAAAVDGLVLQIADLLTELIQEIAEDDNAA